MLLEESSALQECFARALRRSPCSAAAPCHQLMGFDEHIPGDKLKLQNNGKSMNLSFSCQEFGSGVLCHDAAWFTPWSYNRRR